MTGLAVKHIYLPPDEGSALIIVTRIDENGELWTWDGEPCLVADVLKRRSVDARCDAWLVPLAAISAAELRREFE